MDISKILPKRIPSVMIVTGTPGTGKTTLAKRISKKYGHEYIDVTGIIKKQGLADCYDKKRKTWVVDEKKLARLLEKIITLARKQGEKLVIDSHMSHYINPKLVDLCIVTKCGLKELEKRLKKKGYGKAKVEENIESEVFDICYFEAIERGHKVRIVKTDRC